jgi:hypothetical protein
MKTQTNSTKTSQQPHPESAGRKTCVAGPRVDGRIVRRGFSPRPPYTAQRPAPAWWWSDEGGGVTGEDAIRQVDTACDRLRNVQVFQASTSEVGVSPAGLIERRCERKRSQQKGVRS